MKLKITYERGLGKANVDLLVTADPAASVGSLAQMLVQADPDGRADPDADYTLTLPEAGRAELDPATSIARSAVRSGAVVAVAARGDRFSGPAAPGAAVFVVQSGPDSGQEFRLPVGTSLIGREQGCDVRLTDPLVSRRHARIEVGETVEVVDLGSANGLLVGGEASDRVVLREGDSVKLGDSVLVLRSLGGAVGSLGPAGTNAFNRPPRIDTPFSGVELVAPEPPEQTKAQRFPIIPLLAPLLMAPILYFATGSYISLTFVALSPLLFAANALDGRIASKKAYREALVQFRADVADLVAEATAARQAEIDARCAEHAAPDVCVDAAERLGPLLWSRWPDLPGFGELRLGLGEQPSRSRIQLPTGRQNNRVVWRELRDAVAPFATVSPVPVIGRLTETGAIGVAAPRDLGLGIARSLTVQAAVLHSPIDLTVACFVSKDTERDWDWVKWLPHCLPSSSPLSEAPLASTDAACAALVADLERVIRDRMSADEPAGALPLIFVVVENDAPLDRSRITEVARAGRSAGVHLCWLAGDAAQLPAVCRTFINVPVSGAAGSAGFVTTADLVAPLSLEPIGAAVAELVSRALSGVVDATAGDVDQEDLPRSVSLLTLTGRELASSPEAVIERWRESRSVLTGPMAEAPGRRRAGALRAVVGATASGPHTIDLRAQGPHALVGGTTGSGKSELLQSWILGMALLNSPQRVTFLLVDYKGGSAFSDCVELPHTIGLVTDLTPHLVRRALASLSAELRYREQVLHRKRAKDLLELERAGDPDAPPSLVIVVDEFAALVQEVPAFVDGVVDVAQRGRSLGLHLVLATQRPAGVIKDNLRANTNLRLALRMADEADSADVIGTPEAASFDASIPGRAVARTGPSQRQPFQAAYVGGWTGESPPPPRIEIETLGFSARNIWELPDDGETTDDQEGPTDIRRIVSNICAAQELASLPSPRLPWLPELQPVYDLAALPTRRRDDELVFGVADDPDNQRQPMVAFRPDQDGNLAVYGTGGAGKSTLLRTIAVAAGYTVRGGPCHVYGLDFGSRGLQMLEELPHVGSVVLGGDTERVSRLLSMLRTTIDERATRYSQVGAGTITDYRRLAEAPAEPRIILLVDGMGAFRTAYEGTEHQRLFETFLGIAADGRPVGVHVVLSADRPGALPVALNAQVQHRVALRLADPNDYASLGLETDVIDSKSPPGRGLVEDLEVQVAVLGKSVDMALQVQDLQRFATAMRAAGSIEAPPIERLAERVLLEELDAEVDGRPTLGIASETLSAIGFEPRGTFTVAGPPGSGRTSALMTVVSSLRRWQPRLRSFYFGNPRSALLAMFDWERVGADADSAITVATDLASGIKDVESEQPVCLVVIEGIMDFVNGPADLAMQEMVRQVIARGHLVVSEGDTSALMGSYPLLVAARSGRSGIVLQPEQSDAPLFRAQFPRLRRADFPPGRGLFVPRGGQPRVVQVALPTEGTPPH